MGREESGACEALLVEECSTDGTLFNTSLINYGWLRYPFSLLLYLITTVYINAIPVH